MSAPLASMTGFSRSEGTTEQFTWVWELRSVNGRGLELRFRLPPGLDGLEAPLREQATRQLKRGNVSANLTTKRTEQARVVADEAALAQVMKLATDLAARIPGAPPPRAEALLALPGIMRAATAEESEDATRANEAVVRGGFTKALDGLVLARRGEGGRLHAILTDQLDEVAGLHANATIEAAGQPAAQRTRMLESVLALLRDAPPLPEERIAQEVAILASRSDVREELDRLASHVEAARGLLAEGGNIGRRFDFLVQEFNREVNTLCSKSASVALTATGLRLKAAIEQMREQVQNIE